MISSINAHLKALFTCTIKFGEENDFSTPLYEMSKICFIPLTTFIKTDSYIVSPNFRTKLIALNSENVPLKISKIALSILLIIPGTFIGTVIRVVLLVTSQFYRKQHGIIVDHLLTKARNLSTLKEYKQLLPKDVWKITAQYLSVQDLGRMSQVCKEWNTLVQDLWSVKVTYDKKKLDLHPREVLKQKFFWIEKSCYRSFVQVLGCEKILNLPVIVMSGALTSLNSANELDEIMGSFTIVRNVDYTYFAFRCHGQEPGTTFESEGILEIRKFKDSLLIWSPISTVHLGRYNFLLIEKIPPEFFRGQQVEVTDELHQERMLIKLSKASSQTLSH